MTTYRITSSAGIDLGTYTAESPEAALDAMAREAGYESQADAAETVGAFEGQVEAVDSADTIRAAAEADLAECTDPKHDLQRGMIQLAVDNPDIETARTVGQRASDAYHLRRVVEELDYAVETTEESPAATEPVQAARSRASYLIACSAASGHAQPYADEYSLALALALEDECTTSDDGVYTGTDSSGRAWRVELI